MKERKKESSQYRA